MCFKRPRDQRSVSLPVSLPACPYWMASDIKYLLQKLLSIIHGRHRNILLIKKLRKTQTVSGYYYASHIVDMGETFTGDLIELNQGAMA